MLLQPPRDPRGGIGSAWPARRLPGACRELTDAERDARRAERPATVRLRSDTAEFRVQDVLHGSHTGPVDDVVLLRNDGVPAYNLAVVVDDAEQGVDQVVRGDDLLSSAPRQAYLAMLLELSPPAYAHVALAVNARGERLAKRDGALTMADLAAAGGTATDVLMRIGRSLGLTGRTPAEMLEEFDPERLPREPWVVA